MYNRRVTYENTNIPFSAEAVGNDEKRFADKIQAVRGICVDEYGTNLVATASIFYDAVFNPDQVVGRYQIKSSEVFPDRLDTLRAPIETVQNVPEKDAFVEKFVTVWTDTAINKSVLYPGAREALRAIAEHGPTVIWTQGDMYGLRGVYPGFDTGVVPGSFEQMKKVVGLGAGEIRREVARASLAGSGTTDMRQAIKDTLAVVAAEDKFSAASIQKVVEYLEHVGLSKAVVIDDKLGNIETMQQLLAAKNVEARGIWVRQGRYGEQAMTYDASTIHEVDSVASLAVRPLPEGFATICDFDGVFSDQRARAERQNAAVYDLLIRNRWLASLPTEATD